MHLICLSQQRRLLSSILGCVLLALAAGSVSAAELFATLSADTEGHLGPCRECPHHPGLGGLTRRATVLKDLRTRNRDLLLLDAGNFLIGSESLASRGKVMVAAYNALGYDAVNLCHHDFWFGKDSTLGLLKEAKFAYISANFLDEATGKLLVQPYSIKKIKGQRIAVIGVAQAPAGIDFLPHLKDRLAGIRIQPPTEALHNWLPKVKAESDRVILLYYGSASGLATIRTRFADSLNVILVGGLRAEQIAPDTQPPIIATSNHGRHLAQIHFRPAGIDVDQIAVEPLIVPNTDLEQLLAKFQNVPR